jgi:hypothetical protein
MKTFKYSVLIYFISIAVLSGCSVKSGVERKAWFKYASKYDQAMAMMWESGGDLEYYGKGLKIKQKYLRATQPTETEIISILRLPNRSFQRVALVAMSLKPIETDQLIDVLFEFLQDQDLYFRWYAMTSLDKFKKFPESRKAYLGEQLLEIVKKEKDDAFPLPMRFTLLARFPSEKVTVFLTEQMMREGKENRDRVFRYAAFIALKEMGDSYYGQAAEHVNKHGGPEIKKELLNNEKWWEEKKTSKPGRNIFSLEKLLE